MTSATQQCWCEAPLDEQTGSGKIVHYNTGRVYHVYQAHYVPYPAYHCARCHKDLYGVQSAGAIWGQVEYRWHTFVCWWRSHARYRRRGMFLQDAVINEPRRSP